MPSYTDPVSGIRIRTDGPLSPEELDAAFAPTPENIRRYAMNEGRKLGIPAATAVAVIGQESGGDVNAVSPKGARGAAQVMPDTAAMIQRQYGIDMEDPFGRVKGGLLYLRDQYREFGDPTLALAAYNAGPGAVREYGGVPPYPETQQYVASIPTAGWGRPLDEKTNDPSTMPLMSDTLDPVDRTPALLQGPPAPPAMKAVDIPETETLVAQHDPIQSFLAADPLANYTPEKWREAGKVIGLTALPVPTNPLVDIGLGATVGLVLEADRRVGQKMLPTERGPVAYLRAASQLSRDDLMAIGKAGMVAGALTGIGRGVSRAVFGPRDLAREEARQALTIGDPLTRQTVTPPLRTAAGGDALDEFLAGPGRLGLPQANEAATDAAYDAVRAAAGPGMVNVTGVRRILARATEEARQAGYQVPQAFRPETLGYARTIAAGPVRATVYEAPLDTVLQRLSTINKLKNQKAFGVEPSIAEAQLQAVSHDVTTAISRQLSPVARQALDEAIGVRRMQGQLDRLHDLVQRSVDQFGVPQGKVLARQLLARDEGWQAKLGPYYPQALRWAQAVSTLQRKPEGRRVFEHVVNAASGAAAGAGAAVLTGNDPMKGAAGGAGLSLFGPLVQMIARPNLLPTIERLATMRSTGDEFATLAGRAIVGARALSVEEPVTGDLPASRLPPVDPRAQAVQ